MQAIEHAPVRKVLTRLATKAQKAGGGSSLKLDSKTFPEVFAAERGEDADYFWDLLKDAVVSTNVSLLLKPTKAICAEYERGPKLEVTTASLSGLLSQLGLEPAGPTYREEWHAALRGELKAPEHVVEALCPYLLKVDGRSAQEVVGALNRLRTLKDSRLLLREASSEVFWGMSKVLDGRRDMVAKLMDMEECPFDSPLQVTIRVPDSPVTGILFVENQTTFTALDSDTNPESTGLALVFCSGFKASTRRLTDRAQTHCFYKEGSSPAAGNKEEVEMALFEGKPLPFFFFGDLDYSGMGILKALRQNFPSMQAWKPGYGKLIARLLAGEGHSPTAAGKTGQKDPNETGCFYADTVLLPAMRSTGLFVDQE